MACFTTSLHSIIVTLIDRAIHASKILFSFFFLNMEEENREKERSEQEREEEQQVRWTGCW